MSEAARARERLDFEAAAEAIEKGLRGKESSLSTQQFMAMSATAAMQFTPGGLEVCLRKCFFLLKSFTLGFNLIGQRLNTAS